MDVLDEGKLHSQVLDPAITRLNTETIPALQAAVRDAVQPIVDSAVAGVARIVTDLGAEVASGLDKVSAMVASLDGWTLDIVIPTISIRLSKPKTGDVK